METRVAKLYGKEDIRVVNETVPEQDEGTCLVEMTSVGICGSDVHYYDDGGIGDEMPSCPHALGHEPAARILTENHSFPHLKAGMPVYVEPGSHCGKCEFCIRGDINLCQSIVFLGAYPVEGAFRDVLRYPAELLIPLPDGFTDDQGAMLEPLAIAVHCVDLADLRVGDRVAVLGCGCVGLSVLLVLRAMGYKDVLVYDPVEFRMQRAVELGGTPLADLESDQDAQVVFEATDRSSGPRTAVDIAKPGGTLVLIGIPEGPNYQFDAHIARRKGLTLKVIRRSRNTTERALEMIHAGALKPEEIISHHYNIDDVSKAFVDASARIPGLTKAMITF